MAAIVALLIGGKIWGIPGMILAVPSIGIAKILMSYSDSLRPFVLLMDDAEDEITPEVSELKKDPEELNASEDPEGKI